jgi:two-component system phosphate regulon sensor histidine kinase PhoR
MAIVKAFYFCIAMNKKKIRMIIALMSVALAGIISLQIYWIRHDINLKEKQFDQAVIQAMNSVVDQVETREAFHIISNRFFNLDPSRLSDLMLNDTMVDFPVPAHPAPVTELENPRTVPGPPPIFDDLDNADINIEFHQPGNPRTILRFQRKNTHRVDSLEERTIRSSRITRIYSDSSELTIRKNQEKVKTRMEKLQRVMQQMAVEFVGKESEVTQRINPYQLDTIIKSELQNHGINLDCNYGVLNGNTNKLLISKSGVSDAVLLNSRYKTLLFPNDIFSKPDYLILQFPNSIKYVLASMWLMLAGSSLFTLIIVLSFAYTIQVIFRQKKISDIKSDFINNMTHEFKTPIATISLASDSIRDSRVSQNKEKLEYFLNIIRDENKRMNVQVENVLQMALIERGDLEIKKEQVNMHELIEKATGLILLQVQSKEGRLVTELNAGNPLVTGDPMHLSNVIFNLLDNANKYSPLKPDISIRTTNHQNQLRIVVKDEGMGMSKDTQKRIFEKFYRVPTGNLHDIKGFGLGLSYVKAIVEQHGGEITVSSDPGKGSTFEIHLPLAKDIMN